MSRSLIARTALLRDSCVDGDPTNRHARMLSEVVEHLDVLGKRSRIKRQVREERRDVLVEGTTDLRIQPDAVPIIVRDTGPFVHYPASVDDLRGVARLLPPDALSGVSAVELRLRLTGRYVAPPDARYPVRPDPYLGRTGVKALGGAWVSPILAAYRVNQARIFLHAYVFDPAWEDASSVAVAMRFAMLRSFVHEIAHHDDRRRRVARGRWMMDDRERSEPYAEETAERWVADLILPYVLERYGDDVEALGCWFAASADRPDLVEALQGCPLLDDVGLLLRGWLAASRTPDETRSSSLP